MNSAVVVKAEYSDIPIVEILHQKNAFLQVNFVTKIYDACLSAGLKLVICKNSNGTITKVSSALLCTANPG